MSLVIDTKQDQTDRVVFKLTGRLDTQTTPQLDGILDPFLAGVVTTIIFDLEGLEYISSAGLRAIFKAKKTLAARNGTALVVHLQPPVQKVFDIVKAMPTASVFRSWDELDQYLDAMQKKALEDEN
jgi:anti-anti-sigma factor